MRSEACSVLLLCCRCYAAYKVPFTLVYMLTYDAC